MAGCGAVCIRYIFLIFNFLFFLSGALLLAIGIWMFVDKQFPSYVQNIFPGDSNNLIHVSAITLTAVGGFTFVVGFLGCCGACRGSPCMLNMFVILLAVLLVAQIAAAVLAAVFRNELDDGLLEEMKKQVPHVGDYYAKDDLSKAWNLMQARLECCGADHYTDYRNSVKLNQSVPLTCCILETKNPEHPVPIDTKQCMVEAKVDEFAAGSLVALQAEGCYKTLVDWFTGKSAILIGVGVGIPVIEILGIIFACCVKKDINAGEKYA